MRDTLQELNQEMNLRGSMVMTPDGIMVATALGPDYEEDSVAAAISALLVGLKEGLQGLDRVQDLTSCTLNASDGRILLVDMQNSYLVAIAPADSPLTAMDPPVQEAVRKIKNRKAA